MSVLHDVELNWVSDYFTKTGTASLSRRVFSTDMKCLSEIPAA
jgi:hypothetical protein